VRRLCVAFEKRRDLVFKRVGMIDGLTLDPPSRAFCSSIGTQTSEGDTLSDDAEIIIAYILKDADITAVRGSAY
jgi:hypothetical protein